MTFWFFVTRPREHYGSGKNANILKPSAPSHPTGRPDVTKLIRSTEDALTGIVWRDDAQIVEQIGHKGYAQKPGCHIFVRELEPAAPRPTWPEVFAKIRAAEGKQ